MNSCKWGIKRLEYTRVEKRYISIYHLAVTDKLLAGEDAGSQSLIKTAIIKKMVIFKTGLPD